jgi:S1-C subfamily serine protease
MHHQSDNLRLPLSAVTKVLALLLAVQALACSAFAQETGSPSADDLAAVRKFEQARIAAIQRVIGSVIAIYGDDREGGGSGVIIDPSGLALTNHHVIQAAGIEGWGGLADGKLYRWTIIGTDPGGDIALIQMHGRDSFPDAPLGDSDQVRIGDWAMAMGNPFVLGEDETPTVTLGIVSGVNRFQEGAGSNQLVYGNCIQVDSSINPGNSGGPLFNMRGEVIGINGRGSFEERGRVNVGLGYAISANQIKNFIPDLLATKIVEHGTLDAVFELRDGKVVCGSLVEQSDVNEAGLELGDRLVKFERQPIRSVNQYLNLICTLPEGWTAELEIEKADGSLKTLHVPLYGLPYNIEKPKVQPPPDDKGPPPTPEQKKALDRQKKMIDFLSAEPSSIRDAELNSKNAAWLLSKWRESLEIKTGSEPRTVHLIDAILVGEQTGKQETWLASDGRFRINWSVAGQTSHFGFDGKSFWRQAPEQNVGYKLTLVEAKTCPQIIQALAIIAAHQTEPFAALGKISLDGSDKAQNQLACRLKVIDEKQDWFYCWLSLFDSSSRLEVRPLKVSSDLQGEGRGATVIFNEWSAIDGTFVPQSRAFVSGFDEHAKLRLRLESCETNSGIDDSLFTMAIE